MAKQLELPHFGGIERVKKRKHPRVSLGDQKLEPLSLTDVLHCDIPLTPPVRKRLRLSLEKVLGEGNFSLEDVLPEPNLTRVRLYIFPQEDEDWVYQFQNEVVLQVTGDPRVVDFRYGLLRDLGRIVRRSRVGEQALESLKLPDWEYILALQCSIKTVEEWDSFQERSHQVKSIEDAKKTLEGLGRGVRITGKEIGG